MDRAVRPVFHVTAMGRLGNLMIQYLVAISFRNLVPDCAISGISIPVWDIEHPTIPGAGACLVHHHEQLVDLPGWADQMRAGVIDRVEWTGFGQRLEYFPPLDQCRGVFRTPPALRGAGYGPDVLVCPVRAEDVLHGVRDYPLTPIEFYQDIVRTTGLRPVFIGQTEPNAYTERLRAAFPDALFRQPQSDPLVDFETIRQSSNIAVCVSTYVWLAAWLSETARTIFMAVSGLFNLMVKDLVNLLPFGDGRFRFILFPVNFGVPLDRHADVHRRMAPFCREMPHEALLALRRAAPRFRASREAGLEALDEQYYLAAYKDVAQAARGNVPNFARYHYQHHGFDEGRDPVCIDEPWYAAEYPIAGFEVAQGDYASLLQHYMAVGRRRGYCPAPPGADQASTEDSAARPAAPA